MSCSQIAVLLLMVALATSALTASEVFFWYPLAERTSTKRASVLARRECYDEGEVPILDVDDIESLVFAETHTHQKNVYSLNRLRSGHFSLLAGSPPAPT